MKPQANQTLAGTISGHPSFSFDSQSHAYRPPRPPPSRPRLAGFSPPRVTHGLQMLPLELQGTIPTTGSMKKLHCNCRNTHCLKLYCDCFNGGVTCDEELCNCVACYNNQEHEGVRSEAISIILQRNPNAFKSKIVGSLEAGNTALNGAIHHKGCHCKKSNCLKRYCECFTEGVFCSMKCRCQECKNYEGSEDRHAARLLVDSLNSPMKRRKTSNGSPIPTVKVLRPVANYSPAKMGSPLPYISPQPSPGLGTFYNNPNRFSPTSPSFLCGHIGTSLSAMMSPLHATAIGSVAPRFGNINSSLKKMDYLEGVLSRAEIEALCREMLVAARAETALSKPAKGTPSDSSSESKPDTIDSNGPLTATQNSLNAVKTQQHVSEETNKNGDEEKASSPEPKDEKHAPSCYESGMDDQLMCTEENLETVEGGEVEDKDTKRTGLGDNQRSGVGEQEERAVLQRLSVMLRRLATEASQRRRYRQGPSTPQMFRI